MTEKPLYNDHPYEEVKAQMREQIARGADVYQKFTCSGCGQRLGMDDANMIFTHGTCDQCSTITDIKSKGCNFLMMMPGRSSKRNLTEVKS